MSYQRQGFEDNVTVLNQTHLENIENAIIADEATLTEAVGDISDAQDALETKAEIDGYYEEMAVGNAEQLIATVGVTDTAPYSFRTAGGEADIGDRAEEAIIGGTVVWNQQINSAQLANASSGTSSELGTGTAITNGIRYTLTEDVADTGSTTKVARVTAGDAGQTIQRLAGHKLLIGFRLTGNGFTFTNATFYTDNIAAADYKAPDANGWIWRMVTPTGASSGRAFRVYMHGATGNTGATLDLTNAQYFDLTLMLGAAVADMVYAMEQANEGAGVAWFRKLFPNDCYAYNAGELMSVQVSGKRAVGFNAYDPATGTAHVVGGHEYQITGTYTGLTLDGETITPDANGAFTPAKNGTLTVTGGNATDTCVHLRWSGYRDGEWEAYKTRLYPLDSSLTLRGVPKLDGSGAFTFDGDTYESDGTVTRKTAIIDMGAVNWYAYPGTIPDGAKVYYIAPSKRMAGTGGISDAYPRTPLSVSQVPNKHMVYFSNSTYICIRDDSFEDAEALKTALTGKSLVYLLSENYQTAETAEPFAASQWVDDFGTEEFIDAGSRDVAIPCGHQTIYRANLRDKVQNAPDSPSADGDYILRRANGVNAYAPLPSSFPETPTADGAYTLLNTVSNGAAAMAWTSDLSNLQLGMQRMMLYNEILVDDAGLPSHMVRIPKMTYADLGLGDSTDTFPAFIVNDIEVPEIYISKYQNCVIDNLAYSLPARAPQTNITLNTAISRCTAKGTGWHLMTRMEWALLAHWCKKNGFMPGGNNDYGKDRNESAYSAIPCSWNATSGAVEKVLTGTGPVTWSHDGTIGGIWDLNGNVSEWVGGIRLVYGELQVLVNNNAADSSHLQTAASTEWKAINATTGAFVTPDGSGTTVDSVKLDYVSSHWQYDTTISSKSDSYRSCQYEAVTCSANIGDAAKLVLQALGLLKTDDTTGIYFGDYFYANNAASESAFSYGGFYGDGARAGVFCCYGYLTRSTSNAYIGFRSAFVKLPTA